MMPHEGVEEERAARVVARRKEEAESVARYFVRDILERVYSLWGAGEETYISTGLAIRPLFSEQTSIPDNDAYVTVETVNGGAVLLRPLFTGTHEYILTVESHVAAIYFGVVWGSLDPEEWWFDDSNRGKAYFLASSGALCSGSLEIGEAELLYELRDGDQVAMRVTFTEAVGGGGGGDATIRWVKEGKESRSKRYTDKDKVPIHGRNGVLTAHVEKDEDGIVWGLHPAIYLMGRGSKIRFEKAEENQDDRKRDAIRVISRFCKYTLALACYNLIKHKESEGKREAEARLQRYEDWKKRMAAEEKRKEKYSSVEEARKKAKAEEERKDKERLHNKYAFFEEMNNAVLKDMFVTPKVNVTVNMGLLPKMRHILKNQRARRRSMEQPQEAEGLMSDNSSTAMLSGGEDLDSDN